MGVWGDRLLPRVLDSMGSAPEITRLRAAGLRRTCTAPCSRSASAAG